jgi:MoxR-like ATPase
MWGNKIRMNAPDVNIRNAATTILQRAAENIGRIILGKDEQIRLALACLVARGHLLIEDFPGVGKTTLAHAIAQVMGLEFQRIQFTSDLLPADVLGVAVYDRDRAVFEFHQGPIFSNFILADEVNRATPKTQSALLEAMEENQVTVDGETRDLPQPFYVIATQNPMHQIGTYPLPESQLDRFLMRLHLGFPDRQAERELLQGEDRRDMIEHIKPVMDGGKLISIQKQAAGIYVSDALLDYVQSLLAFTRSSPMFEFGLSPRGGLALLGSARALALIDGKDFVLPEHIKQVLPAVVNHRLVKTSDELDAKKLTAADFISESVPVP